LFSEVVEQAGAQGLLSNEHFKVVGTLIEACVNADLIVTHFGERSPK